MAMVSKRQFVSSLSLVYDTTKSNLFMGDGIFSLQYGENLISEKGTPYIALKPFFTVVE